MSGITCWWCGGWLKLLGAHMRRFRWLYYLLRPSRVDFAMLAREPLPERMLARWLRDIPRDGRVHSTPNGVGVIRMKDSR